MLLLNWVPGAGVDQPAVLVPLHLHGVVAHGLKPGLKVGEGALPDAQLVLDRRLELGRLGGDSLENIVA